MLFRVLPLATSQPREVEGETERWGRCAEICADVVVFLFSFLFFLSFFLSFFFTHGPQACGWTIPGMTRGFFFLEVEKREERGKDRVADRFFRMESSIEVSKEMERMIWIWRRRVRSDGKCSFSAFILWLRWCWFEMGLVGFEEVRK